MDAFFENNAFDWENFDWASNTNDNALDWTTTEPADQNKESTTPALVAPTAHMVEGLDQRKGGIKEMWVMFS